MCQPVTPQDGNGVPIDLMRPEVRVAGSRHPATERNGTYEIEGKHLVLPQIVNGRLVTEDDAVAHYLKTGQHHGEYSNAQEALEASIKRSDDIGRMRREYRR